MVILVCIVLVVSGSIWIYVLFWTQTNKKNYFLLMQNMVIIYLIGYLLELLSANAGEVFVSVKILYIGSSFVAAFAFFFVADYCNIKLHTFLIKVPMLLLSLASTLLMWTTKFHHLVYRDSSYQEGVIHHLKYTPGPLYPIIQVYPAFCILLAMVILIYQMKKWEGKYRNHLIILFMCLVIPFITEGIHFLIIVAGINRFQFYLTPYSITIMSLCLFLGAIRFNIFEIISVATETAMDHIREGFILVDNNNNYLSCNPAAAKILPGIMKLHKGEPISSASDWPIELKDVQNSSVDFSISDEKTKFFRASVSPVLSENQSLVARIILFSDITDNINLMKELENAAYIDSLTGLYNRKHFTELANVDIERALRLNQFIYTVMLDLDFFKKVNDTYGHAAGDIVLKITAGIIRQTIRFYDLLGRYGGEEFVLLITALDIQEAHKLMERIRENMEHSIINYEGQEIKITCSIGLAKFEEKDDLESAIKKSDEALYAAKKSGRNQVKIYPAS